MNEYSVKKMSEYPVNPSPLSEDLIPTITVEGGKFVNRNIEFSKLKGDKGDTGPQGEPGDDGNTGASGKAATVEVGSVSTGPAGSSATVENTGDEYDAVLDFTIPKGDKGDQGDPGVVQSVNGKSQEDVVLYTDDIADTATNRYTNDTDIARLADTSGENTGDQDLSGLATDAELTAGLATKEPTITAGTTSQYYRGDKTWQTLNTTAVGIPNVNNTSDMDKPVSTAQAAADALKVDKVNTANTLYGVNGSGVQASFTVSQAFADNSIAQRSTGGTLSVGAATSGTHATNKNYVDAADALKVNKAGDTMTGILSNIGISLPFRHQRSATGDISMGTGNSNNFIVVENVGAVRILDVQAGRLHIGDNTKPAIIHGTGFPNGVVSAPVGSIYIDTAVTNGASSWIKKSGTGNTGWQVLEGDTGWRNVASSIINGWTIDSGGYIYVKRTGESLSVRAVGLNSTASSSDTFLDLGASFGVGSGGSFVGASAHTVTAPATIYRSAINTSGGYAISRPGSAIAVRYSIDTNSTAVWPTTLPGTAV